MTWNAFKFQKIICYLSILDSQNKAIFWKNGPCLFEVVNIAHGKIINTLPLSKLLGLVESGRWNQESAPPSSSQSRRLEKVPSGPQDHCLAGPWSQDHHCLAGLWTLARGTPATATGMIGDLLMWKAMSGDSGKFCIIDTRQMSHTLWSARCNGLSQLWLTWPKFYVAFEQ